MGDSPLHPAIVHIPIALAILMPVLSLGLLVAWWKDWLPGRVWFVAVALQAVLVAGVFAALQTGEADEERVEEVVAHDVLEEHEELGETLLWAAGGAFGLMLLPFFVPGERRKRYVGLLATAATAGVTVLALNVGKAGGELVYEHGAADAYTEGADQPARSDGDHVDDDD